MPVPAPNPHFVVIGRGRRYSYSYPRKVSIDPPPRPARDRATHGAMLRDAFETIRQELRPDWEAHDHSADFGVQLEFCGELGFALETDSLDLRSSGIELVNTRVVIVPGENDVEERTQRFATVFVPYNKISLFLRKTEAYLTKNGSYRNPRTNEVKDTGPKNAALLEGISLVRRAMVASFWTEREPFPDANTFRWWEVWLRVGAPVDQRDGILARFIGEADRLGMRRKGSVLNLPEQVVLLVFGSANQFAQSGDLLTCLAELRAPATTAAFFAGLDNIQMQHWARSLAPLLQLPAANAPTVCLFDTGVNHTHPLLTAALPANRCDTVVPGGAADADGHGTQMAGLALLGDLTETLQTTTPVELEHTLESIKVLPDPPQTNEPENWGSMMKEAAARAHVFSPPQQRVINLAIGALDGRNAGKPSAWSTAIDQVAVASDANGQPPRLIVVAAGNATREEPDSPLTYPNSNRRLAIHNPAQAWNALTVGAYTEKTTLTQTGLGTPIARRGGLSPCSSTSIIWENQWPIKPEIVCEGGNYVLSPQNSADLADDLQLVTTGRNFLYQPLTLSGDTSAASALASRMAARLFARYPGIWPETVRALLVHFAEWTPEMLGGRDAWDLSENELRELLRTVGYGSPDFARAASSDQHRVTLLIQDELQPYAPNSSGVVQTRDYKRHKLPMPADILANMLDTPVTLRATLSYFVEPNPGPRDVDDRFRYAGAGLRFDLQRAGESPTAFARRTSSRSPRAPTDPVTNTQESGRWLIGRPGQRGSIIHDRWQGTAADLAGREHIHVYPVTGWWRYRRHLNRFNTRLRYSLVVTIETPPEAPEIYTKISQLVAAEAATPVPVEIAHDLE